MNESFFLTKQTANLMEDFDRELEAGSSLSLLYGETRVGKTRLLQELVRTRLGDRRVHGIELRSSNQDGKGKQDRSGEIEKIFAQAKSGDIIIADHFESALKKTRHQVFVSWSTYGIDKQLYVIVCSNLDGFNELRELTLRYKVSARSFRLKPLSADEVEAFFAFYLFQDQLVGKLIFPPYLRKQIAESRGVVGHLIDIAIRDGDQIENVPLKDLESSTQQRWIAGTLIVMVLLAAGLGWYMYSAPDSFDSIAEAPLLPETLEPAVVEQTRDDGLSSEELAIEPEPEAVVVSTIESTQQTTPALDSATDTVETISAEPASESMVESVISSEPEPEPEPELESAEEIASLAAAEEAAPVEASAEPAATATIEVASASPEISEIVTEPAIETEDSTPNESVAADSDSDASVAEPEAQPDAEIAEVEDTPTITYEPADEALSTDARFARDLRASLDWLSNRPDETGMVQIMLLRANGFDSNTYYTFLDKLERNNVDLSQVRVFRTMTANRVNYGIFYDEFPTRRDALRSLEFLPEAIRDTAPIPRSVGGLRDEIRRLGEDN